MGAKLVKLFEFVEDEKGIMGKVAIAKLTKITQITAPSVPDSPDVVAAFIRAAAQVTGKTPPRV
jgi:hypothetical protein